MRDSLLPLLSCAALLMACQPVTPIPVKTKSPNPDLKITDAVPITPAEMAPPVTRALPVASKPAETLSSGPDNQKKKSNQN